MDKVQATVLNKLLDQYEQSKTFLGQNKVNQSFDVKIGKVFPKYQDDAEYDFFREVNVSLKELEKQGLIRLEGTRNGVLERALLQTERLEDCYARLKRVSRKEEQKWLTEVWKECLERLAQKETAAEARKHPLFSYLEAQQKRLSENKNIEYFDGNHRNYRDLLKLAEAVAENQEELFVRDLSVRLFLDSKRVEQLCAKVQSLLFQYGDYEEKESVLEECGVVRTPTYVMLKGNGCLNLAGQQLDLSGIKGDVALSTASLKELTEVRIKGSRVVTIENLTAFHDYDSRADFTVYLGGFHNRIKRDFLCFLYRQNPEKEYCHFGDLDAGGFYILEHLKRKTGIPFRSLWMDEETLRQFREYTVPMTANDRKRLQDLLLRLEEQERRGELKEDYRGVLSRMLSENCKLEQELAFAKSGRPGAE